MLKYCINCKSVVELNEDRCCKCGQQISFDNNNSRNNKFYLPEPYDVIVGQIGHLWKQACEFMTTNNLNGAGEMCCRILGISPDHEDARNMQDEIERRSRQVNDFYDTINKGIGNQSLSHLISLLKEATRIYPDHVDGHLVQIKLLSVTTEYKNVMFEGIKAIGVGHWQEAIAHFERAGQLNPGYLVVIKLINFANTVLQQIEAARRDINDAMRQGNKRKAMSLARGVDQLVEGIKNKASQL
jgi:hypothetical protein